MTRVILDAALSKTLRNSADEVEFCDEAGQTLGYFRLAPPVPPPAARRSPLSIEEIQQRRKEPRTGRRLADILKDLGAS